MRAQRGRRGFSLIELLVVVFMLAVGLTSVSALFVAGIVSSHKAERLSDAVDSARREMERTQSGGYSSCVVSPVYFPSTRGYTLLVENEDGTGQVGFAVPDLPSGQGTITISFYNSGAGTWPSLKLVTVRVSWDGGRGNTQSCVLQSYVANHP